MPAVCPLHPQPRDTGGRHICNRCVGDTIARLDNIALLAAVLPDLATSTSPEDSDVRTVRHAPPAPCRLDILDLTDPRSDTPALPLLHAWTMTVASARAMIPPASPDAQASWLVRHVAWMAAYPQSVHLAADIRRIDSWLRSAAGDTRPPIMSCPIVHPDADGPCAGPVYPVPDQFAVKCARCSVTFDGSAEMSRLGMIAAPLAPHEQTA